MKERDTRMKSTKSLSIFSALILCLALQPLLATSRTVQVSATRRNLPPAGPPSLSKTKPEENAGSERLQSLINKACFGATNQALCHHILASDPENKQPNRSLKRLAFFAFQVASKNLTSTSAFIKKSLGDPELDPDVQQGLADCQELYISAAEQVEDSIDDLVSEKYSEADKFMSAALADIETCDNGLGKSGPAIHVAVKNHAVRQSCSIAISVALVASKN